MFELGDEGARSWTKAARKEASKLVTVESNMEQAEHAEVRGGDSDVLVRERELKRRGQGVAVVTLAAFGALAGTDGRRSDRSTQPEIRSMRTLLSSSFKSPGVELARY